MASSIEEAWADLGARYRRERAVFRSKWETIRRWLAAHPTACGRERETILALMDRDEEAAFYGPNIIWAQYGASDEDRSHRHPDNLYTVEQAITRQTAESLARLRVVQQKLAMCGGLR